MPDKKDESSKADSKNQRNKEGKDEEEEEKVWPERTDPQCRLPRVVIKWLVRCQKTCKKQMFELYHNEAGVYEIRVAYYSPIPPLIFLKISDFPIHIKTIYFKLK